MDIFFEIFFGVYAGWITSNRMHSLGFSVILGILGAISASFILESLDLPGVYGYNMYSFFVAVTGAAACIHLGRLLMAAPLFKDNAKLGLIAGVPILKPI